MSCFRQDFGRVQALIIVFSRIVDVESFSEVVLSAVKEEEKRELQHRLGILNVLNPVRVSGGRYRARAGLLVTCFYRLLHRPATTAFNVWYA